MENKLFNSFKRSFYLGWRNFYREKGISFITVLVLTIVLVLSASVFLIGVITEDAISEVKQNADITIDFELATSTERILEVQDRISNEFNINDINYTSREEAKSSFIRRFGDRPAIMEALEEVGNPLPASLSIRADDSYTYHQIASFLEDEYADIIYNIDLYNREEVIDGIFGITENVKAIGISISIVMGIVAIFLVYNTIKLAIYGLREEIRVMRLVGASNTFIRGSFIVQGALIGIFAAILALPLSFLIGVLLSGSIDSSGLLMWTMMYGSYEQYFILFITDIIILQFGLGIILGVTSSFVSTGRYLKK